MILTPPCPCLPPSPGAGGAVLHEGRGPERRAGGSPPLQHRCLIRRTALAAASGVCLQSIQLGGESIRIQRIE